VFQSTPNRENYQGRYIMRHPFKGKITCDSGRQYMRQLSKRQEQEAQTLASLTGWDINEIRKKMGLNQGKGKQEEESWWDKIFKDNDED
jgi:hypothetical protein